VIGSPRSGSPAGASTPKPTVGGTPDHRWSITAARLPPNRRSRPCRLGKQASPPTPPPLHGLPFTAPPRHRVDITRRFGTGMPANAPRRPTHTDPDRPVRHVWADHTTLTLTRSTTPATILASGGRRHAGTPTAMLRARDPKNSDNKLLSAGMPATLFAGLEERVAVDLVAGIVRGSWTRAGKSFRIWQPGSQ
jgi:hypothetical protein